MIVLVSIAVAPAFTKPLEDIEAEEGAPLKLNVKFEGQPDPSVTWYTYFYTLNLC